ncbi:MAG: hypothetical protein KAR05_04125 [Candidatus Omnitrophica bacterium]|nr:hypothetical protein [Candidatus Omnitrophota bacterium]
MSRIAKRIKKNKEVFMTLHKEGNWNKELTEVLVRGKKALDETCGVSTKKSIASFLFPM